MDQKPLFMPLKAEYFDAFADGTKTIEYRKSGGKWNAKNCTIGRSVTLSSGYGKAKRLSATISSYSEKLPNELGADYNKWAVACDTSANEKVVCIEMIDIKPVTE